MKKSLAILLTATLLSGCTLVDAFLMRYDPNEYQQITDIRTTAYFAKSSCDNVEQSKLNASIIAKKTVAFKNLAEYLPHNDKVISASVDLDKIAQGLNDQYSKGKVSTTFCKIKFQSIEKSAEIMQQTIGDKPR